MKVLVPFLSFPSGRRTEFRVELDPRGRLVSISPEPTTAAGRSLVLWAVECRVRELREGGQLPPA